MRREQEVAAIVDVVAVGGLMNRKLSADTRPIIGTNRACLVLPLWIECQRRGKVGRCERELAEMSASTERFPTAPVVPKPNQL